MVPGNARRRHPVIEERIQQLAEFADTFAFNRVEMGRQPADAGHRHLRRGLPVRQRGLSRGLVSEAGHDLSPAARPDPRLRGQGGPADRDRGAGPLHRRRDPADGHRVRGQEHLSPLRRARSPRRARERHRGRAAARVGRRVPAEQSWTSPSSRPARPSSAPAARTAACSTC